MCILMGVGEGSTPGPGEGEKLTLEREMKEIEKHETELIVTMALKDAFDVMKVFGFEKDYLPVLECEIGCLLAVVFYAMRRVEGKRALNVDEIFRWKKIILPLICEEMGEEEPKEEGGE